jgi:GNAT superfamily N-acetyltransferase
MSRLVEATPSDWLYIDSLRKKEGNALGFIPKDAYISVLSGAPVDGRRRYEYQRLWLIRDNDDPTGYVYASFVWPMASVWQIVVQEDARRWERATKLLQQVEHHAMANGMQGIKARVADDLEAVLFWEASGYTAAASTNSTYLNQGPSKSGRKITTWVKRFQPLLDGLLVIA